ncbi:MAG: hypothetical protein H7833_07150 [Magnetococcus sp. DMHC-1]
MNDISHQNMLRHFIAGYIHLSVKKNSGRLPDELSFLPKKHQVACQVNRLSCRKISGGLPSESSSLSRVVQVDGTSRNDAIPLLDLFDWGWAEEACAGNSLSGDWAIEACGGSEIGGWQETKKCELVRRRELAELESRGGTNRRTVKA